MRSAPAFWRNDLHHTRRRAKVTGMQGHDTAPTTAHDLGIEVGHYFAAAWGYGQTNIDFHQVTKISKSGKSVTLARCETETIVYAHEVSDVEMNDRVVPGKVVGDPISRKLRIHEDTQYNRETGDVDRTWTAWTRTADWAGAPRPRWCGPSAMPERKQTNSGFGH